MKKYIFTNIRLALSAALIAFVGEQTESWALVVLCLLVACHIETQCRINAHQKRINLAQLSCVNAVKDILRP